jgi:ATP/maltotriose-dependent transcriptional regulator MalT
VTTPKISTHHQYRIEVMLARWRGKLTWQALLNEIELELGVRITRQALCSYVAVKECYANAKRRLRSSTLPESVNVTVSQVKLVAQIDDLKAEIIVLRRNNAEQLRMIERILANAVKIPNLDIRDLLKNRPEEIV